MSPMGVLAPFPLGSEWIGGGSWIFLARELGGSQVACENSGSVTPPTPHSVTLSPTVHFLSEPQGKPGWPHIDQRERERETEARKAQSQGRWTSGESELPQSRLVRIPYRAEGGPWTLPALGPMSHLPIRVRGRQVHHFPSLAPYGG